MIKTSAGKTIQQLLEKDGTEKFLYSIPPYQRAYTWGIKDWDCIFDDLYDNNKGYFLGSLICIDSDTETNEYKKMEVIDGQQRLTTLSILLLAIYSKMKELILKSNSLLATKKYRTAYDTIEEMLYPELSGSSAQYRFLPSIQNKNQDDYKFLIENVFQKAKVKIPDYYGNRNIKKSFDYFIKKLVDLLQKSNDNDNFDLLYEFYLKIQDAKMIHIVANNAQSAFLLFESLNNRGVPLSAIDLIKNKILEKIGGDVEKQNEEWQKILNNIGEKPNLQERFLRHFYMAYIDDLPVKNKKEDGIIIPKVTKSNLIDLYNQQINNQADATFVFDKLIEKSVIYGLLINPENLNDETPVDKKYQSKLINLKHLGVSSAYMLLSFLFDKYKEQDFTKLLDYLEFWFICRHATNHPATNQLDKIFIDLVKSQKECYDFEMIKSTLDTYIDQTKTREALENTQLYEDMSAVVRSLLIRLEQKLRNKQTEVDFWQLTEKGKLVWSIEHIYPQKPKSELDWGSGENIKLLKEKLHSLGNLTLTCYNSSYSNKKYADKCQVQDDDKLVGLINGDVKINQTLPEPSSAENTWTADKIDERTEWLINNFVSFLDKD